MLILKLNHELNLYYNLIFLKFILKYLKRINNIIINIK